MKFKIALLQLLPAKSLEEQLEIGIKACREAKEKGADVALFPEMWSDGYYLPQDTDALDKLAISKDSDFVNAFRDLAKELGIAIGITFLEKGIDKPLNSVVFFDMHGEEIMHYSKVHICAFDDEVVLQGGDDFYVADLDFGKGTVKFGSMICFDREFPESARILMLKGAEIILAPNACPMEINRLSALRTRAYENMVAVATCNYPMGQPDCNGHSTLFDGVAWLRDEPGVRDMCVFEAPEEPGVYIAELDLDLLRSYRENEIMGDKYRHPERYEILCEQKPEERIRQMEEIYDKALEIMDKAKEDPDSLLDFQCEISKLEDYYTGKLWMKDFELDEAGKLPADLKRGVLSEDGIYNLLERNSELLGEIGDDL